MYKDRDTPAICCYPTIFLADTRRLLSSLDELAKEVHDGASPLRRLNSLSGLASSQPEQAEWKMKRLLSVDRKSTRLNSSHSGESRMPSSA